MRRLVSPKRNGSFPGGEYTAGCGVEGTASERPNGAAPLPGPSDLSRTCCTARFVLGSQVIRRLQRIARR